ncbi:Protein unc-93 B1 [Liparis tanakae]|uniref:Protein unc-93 B1 n=1 Tax=Liparis tanakae TaxID=230148 RepID=A0A4Z2EFT6_9TELE|nr:Protein unc-93 B1 [Liparis tanakae]
MFLASGIYALFVSTNYWERYYTLVPSAVAIGVAIVKVVRSGSTDEYKTAHWLKQGSRDPAALFPEDHLNVVLLTVLTDVVVDVRMAQQYYEYVHYTEDHGQKKLPKGACHHQLLPHFTSYSQLLTSPPTVNSSLHLLQSTPHFTSYSANISGMIPGFNTTVLTILPRSMLLILVESVLMGFAFLAMIIVSPHY